MKPVAKRLIESFGSLSDVLDASAEDLEEVDGVGESAITLIHYVKQVAARYLKQFSYVNINPENIDMLIEACRMNMASLSDEQFRVICLNANFVVVGDEVIAEGTIDQATVYPRKVIETALKHNATTLIFVHNHPSGDSQPSEMDKPITKGLLLAARTENITVYDHLIVSKMEYFSFRENSLI